MPKQTKFFISFVAVLIPLLILSYTISSNTYAKDGEVEDSSQDVEDSHTETPEPRETEVEDNNDSSGEELFRERVQSEIREKETEGERSSQDDSVHTEENRVRERIQIESKDGKTRVEINKSGVKVKYEYENGKLQLHAEDESGQSTELDEDALARIDDILLDDDIKVATESGERFVLQKGAFSAVTSMPVSIDISTNTLVVTTPAGEKILTILPDVVIANLLRERILTRIESDSTSAPLEERINLSYKDGEVKYLIKGTSTQKFLGILPVEIEREVEVSGQTGEVVNTNQNLLSRILDLISF